MMGKTKIDSATEYRETPVKPAVYTMLVVIVVVAAPLGWLNQKIGAEGFRVADTTQYQNLVREVGRDVKSVERMLNSERVDKKNLKGTLVPTVTLITPDIMPTNMEEAVADNGKFKVVLSGIYWSPTDPIATLNGENYHTGEVISGHRIVEIRKTEVVFEDPMGDKLVKYFYDYLDKPKR